MTVELLNYTPLRVADIAIGKCWDKGPMPTLEKAKERMYRVANKNKHGSTIEHLVYSFDIDGISRACLQELARHRIASLSVKSTRYTLKELKNADRDTLEDFLVPAGKAFIDAANVAQLLDVQIELQNGASNDVVKYGLPEAFKTSLVWTCNARSLQGFLSLRTSNAALPEIQRLARKIYTVIPEDHKFLFKDYVNDGIGKNSASE
jgi:thymidylate synthase (FAD)